MSSYNSLPLSLREALTISLFLSAYVYTMGLVRMARQGRRDVFPYAAVSFGLLLDLAVFRYVAADLSPYAVPWDQAQVIRFTSLPAVLILALILGLAGGAVFSLRHVLGLQKTRITTLSVKESADSLPAGLCFYWPGGFPKLVNRVMDEISFGVRGKSIQNGELFWQSLSIPAPKGTETGGEILRSGKNPLMRLADGRVYSLRRHELTFEDRPIYEIVANDITEEYARSEMLREKRAAAEDAEKRLRSISGSIAQLTVDREVLGMKIRVHDNLNRALLAVKRALGTGDPAAKEEAARLWREKILSLDYLTQSENDDVFADLESAAEQLGARIEVKGVLPRTAPLLKLGALAVEVGLSNMLRHADGTVLTVDCTTPGVMVLTNDGRPPEGEIQEGGGLGNLRRRVEEEGCRLEIRSAPVFSLTVDARKPKEPQNETAHEGGR